MNNKKRDKPNSGASLCSFSSTSVKVESCRKITDKESLKTETIKSSEIKSRNSNEKQIFCGMYKGKKTCHEIGIESTYKIKKPKECSSLNWSTDSSKKIIKNSTTSTKIMEKSKPCLCTNTSLSGLSKNLVDSYHKSCGKNKQRSENSHEWKAPCKASDFDDKKDYYIGKCTKEQLEKVPPKRPNWVPKFNLTENPIKTQCLRNFKKVMKPKKPEERFKEITEKIKLAENIDTPSVSEESKSICVEMDLENPLELDFQGTDYQFTYEKDEQNIEDQKEYLKKKRHVDRKVLKSKIGKLIDDKLFNQKISTPKYYDINKDYNLINVDKKSFAISLDSYVKLVNQGDYVEQDNLVTLYRIHNKPTNKAIQHMEYQDRYGRYYDLHMKKLEKEAEKSVQQAEIDQIAKENFNFNIAEQDFNEFLVEKQEEIQTKIDSLPQIERKKWYPHNLKETKILKHKMRKSRKILHEKRIIEAKFYKEKGIEKNFNESDLSLSYEEDLTTPESCSEQSTEDEDDISVGQKVPDKYLLRGFHFRLGSEPRGKLHLTQKREAGRALRTCQTRTEWFDSLIPKTKANKFVEFTSASVARHQSPDDHRLILFPPGKPQIMTYDSSPIKEFIDIPLGLQYKKKESRTVKVKKPNYVKVKKFNLTGYMFGAKPEEEVPVTDNLYAVENLEKLLEYIQAQEKKEKFKKRKHRRQRMRYLGIPVKQIKNIKKTTENCDREESEISDWIPEQEDVHEPGKIDMNKISKITLNRSVNARIFTGPLGIINNAPAPKFRETTLRRHPRRPRTQAMSVSGREYSENLDIPRLEEPEESKLIRTNLKMKKTAYTDLFDARHHHDHSDPTHHNDIRVKYARKVPKVQTEEKPMTEIIKRRKQRTFEKALPQGQNPGKFIDYSLPQPPLQITKSALQVHQNEQINKNQDNIKEESFEVVNALQTDKQINSKMQFTHRSKYLKIIASMAKKIKSELRNIENYEEENIVDKEAYLQELEEEWKSVKSCISSLNSSKCTNFTNESGSFLVVQNLKIPLDYVRKSLVPFEEIDRARVKASIRKPKREYYEPYEVVPFAGQRREQLDMSFGNVDKFYTFNSRMRNGLRVRVEVEPVDLKKDLIGTNKFKALAHVATDLDENYLNDLEHSVKIKNFRPKTSTALIKDALRKKYEVWTINTQIIEQQIAAKKEVEYAEEIIKLNKLLDSLFSKWEKREYDRSKKKTRAVKPYYDATDYYKKELQEFERDYIRLNMQIVFLEDDWIRRTILQNFHYLLMKNNWREENDWIHKKDDGSLENYRESIEKRKTVNIRVRDRDDAWAIKEFYENHFMKNNHPIVIVFPNADSFNKAVRKLKAKTFVCLLELHYTLWILINLENTFRQYVKWSEDFVQTRSKFVKAKCKKKYFMEEREEKLKQIAFDLLDKPLYDSISSPRLRQIKSIGNVVYDRAVPEHIRRNVKEDLDIVQKMGMIFNILTDLFLKLDEFPSESTNVIEKKYRKRLNYNKRQSAQAYQIEKRILVTLEEIKRNMDPPYKKPKRTTKLPRFYLKKKEIIKPIEEKKMSAKAMYFYKAFVPDEDERSIKEEDADIIDADSIQDTVIPFYFDHFLRLNNYIPNYNFKTQIELTYGPEEKPFRYKKVLPDIYRRLQQWKETKKKKMEADIRKTANLYTNVSVS